MKRHLPFLMLVFCITVQANMAQDAEKPLEDADVKLVKGRSCIAPPPPTLGVSLQKPDPTLLAQLPELPPGIGFLVVDVEDGGPAAQAGMRVHDVIWKLGDQMLVNKAQMASLLRLRQVGEMVVFTGFRSGKPHQFKIQLGKPKSRLSGVFASVESSEDDRESGITRIINTSEMFAKTTGSDGVAEIVKVGEGYRLNIKDRHQAEIFNGPFPAEEAFEGVPTAWRSRVVALKRALDQSLNGELPVVRQPRPRVVPPITAPAQSIAP